MSKRASSSRLCSLSDQNEQELCRPCSLAHSWDQVVKPRSGEDYTAERHPATSRDNCSPAILPHSDSQRAMLASSMRVTARQSCEGFGCRPTANGFGRGASSGISLSLPLRTCFARIWLDQGHWPKVHGRDEQP